jgi:hypothetical protein
VVDTLNSINNHFRQVPHYLKGAALQAVHAQFKQWQLYQSCDILSPLVEHQPIPAILHLRIHPGWRCKHCDEFLSVDLGNTQKHLRTRHSLRRAREDRDFEACSLQTVFGAKRLIRYFRVLDQPGLKRSGADPDNGNTDRFVSTQSDILNQIATAEKREAEQVQAFDHHKSSVIPWVRSCGFDQVLKGFETKETRQCWCPVGDEELDGDLVQRVVRVAGQMLEETWKWCVDGPGYRLTRPIAVQLSQF